MAVLGEAQNKKTRAVSTARVFGSSLDEPRGASKAASGLASRPAARREHELRQRQPECAANVLSHADPLGPRGIFKRLHLPAGNQKRELRHLFIQAPQF